MRGVLKLPLAFAAGLAMPALAQAQSNAVQNRWPDSMPTPQQSAPSPFPAPPAAKPARPAAQAPAPATTQAIIAPEPEPLQDNSPPPKRKAPAAPVSAAGGGTNVACSGVFAKESTHIKLAMKYDTKNVTFGEVEGPDNTKIPSSILYPDDARRRLEVMWTDETARSQTSLIAINGKSQWTAPRGVKLGMPLAALEKANGKPFKIAGFDTSGIAQVADWNDGALAKIPGGCKIGLKLAFDAKASEAARSAVAGDKERLSNDPALRAVKPNVSEILIGY